MASDPTAKTVNGIYGPSPPHAVPEQQLPSHGVTNNTAATTTTGSSGTEASNVPSASPSAHAGSGEGSGNVAKDEVGWYFVEQYYTTLSKHPEKLHLFYNKRSQFVSGVEAEKVSVSVGQRAINERIKELDIQDCKVRVSNVDSQESFKNIVVQVIGEMSNKAAPHRKFVQTFVLAEQPNGYFVLNDIFRYINEDEEELEAEDPSTTEAFVPEEPVETLATSTAVDIVDEKLEAQQDADNASPEEPVRTPSVPNGTEAEEPSSLEPAAEEPTNAHTVDITDDKVTQENTEKAVVEDEVEPEKPRDPDPTPIASPPKQAPPAAVQAPVPAVPPKPAAPKTWANMVAANRVAANANPNPGSSASTAPSQPKNASAPVTQPTTPPAVTGEEAPGRVQPNGNTGWQTAGTDNNRRQARGQSISGNNERETILGYVKNVTDKVDASILKNTLNSFGKLAYFDVSRQKNCAFVEFETLAGYQAAVAASPLSIGGEQIFVEERRLRQAGSFNARGGMRGGRGNGRPGSQGRGNFIKDGGRGNFRGGRGQ